MRFKTDENLPTQIVELLRQHGHDAMSVPEQQMSGQPDQVTVPIECGNENMQGVLHDLI